MRPFAYLAMGGILLTIIAVIGGLAAAGARQRQHGRYELARLAVASLGLTDLALSTEARYTRHPAVSDGVVPFMDHPGGLEHFPSGSFFAPAGR